MNYCAQFRFAFVALAALSAGCDRLAAVLEEKPQPTTPVAQAPAAQVSFNRDVAPILYQNCTTCHRPGEGAPFDLLTYEDARKHAEQIAEVTHSRYMPPWLPVKGYGDFADERRLTPAQIDTLRQWADAGTPEGLQQDRQVPPEFTLGWQLGTPDLVVTLPESYTLPAEGRDVYRNFVIPLNFTGPRFIRGMEMRFDNPRIVHHAFALFDASNESLELDAEDAEQGYDGMEIGGHLFTPPGQIVSWQPGKVARFVEPGMTYRIEPGTDLVLQTHMQPSGRPERLRPKVGFYFSREEPTKFPFKIMLRRVDIDIPAGEARHEIRDSYTLPVDAKVIAILPHAHYLGKSVEAYALTPTGEKVWLLKIDDWDFNWQGDYRYKKPIYLVRGTEIFMKWTFDNSAANPRNPSQPPQRVVYGPQTSDEMGELWLQVVPSSYEGWQILHRDQQSKLLEEVITVTQSKLARGDDFKAARRQYQALMLVGRDADALPPAEIALRLQPDSAPVNLEVGFLYFRLARHDEAQRLLLRAIELDDAQPKSHYLLGLSLASTGQSELAISHMRKAIVLHPNYVDARNDLGRMLLARRNYAGAVQEFSAALRLAPQRNDIRENLEKAKRNGR